MEGGGKDNITLILMTDETGPVKPEEEKTESGDPAEETKREEAEA